MPSAKRDNHFTIDVQACQATLNLATPIQVQDLARRRTFNMARSWMATFVMLFVVRRTLFVMSLRSIASEGCITMPATSLYMLKV